MARQDCWNSDRDPRAVSGRRLKDLTRFSALSEFGLGFESIACFFHGTVILRSEFCAEPAASRDQSDRRYRDDCEDDDETLRRI